MKYFLIIMICLFTLLNTAFASQNGSISGYVYDQKYRAVQGVNIYINGTNLSGETNEKGYYKIIGVRAGTYIVKFGMIGFHRINIHNVRIVPDSDTEVIQCLFEEEISYPAKYGFDYDGSNCKIEPNNSSSKNISFLESGYDTDIKEVSKYSKSHFADLFHTFKDSLNSRYPIDKKLEGLYVKEKLCYAFSYDKNFLILTVSEKNYDYKTKYQLLNTGNNRFLGFYHEVIFEDSTANITDNRFGIRNEIFKKDN